RAGIHADEQHVALGETIAHPAPHQLPVTSAVAEPGVAIDTRHQRQTDFAARIVRGNTHAVRSLGGTRPWMSEAVVMVLASRQAMVMGPTPPGTGVMAPATSLASAKATSPTSRVLPSPFSGAGMRLMPTSMTVAPPLTQSPRIISGRPTAATRTSAVRHSAGRSFVRE